MIRSQVLLTPELDKQIKKISQNNDISQSEVVRRLLQQSLSGSDEDLSFPTKTSKKQKYLYRLDDFRGDNPRINGFKEIYSVGGKTTEVVIVDDSTFRYYKKEKKLPEGLDKTILNIANDLKELAVTRKLVVRRAYLVPGIEFPPGPRFLGIRPDQVVDSIKELYEFAIEHEYDKKGSSIDAFFYPFADPRPESFTRRDARTIPYGGYGLPLNEDATKVEILATWGNNEGVQSFDTIDRYVVDTGKGVIQEKDIPQKMSMMATTQRTQSEKIEVPLDKQFEQVLGDMEILESARIVKELSEKYGLRRTEFSFDGKDSLIYNESVPYEISEKRIDGIDIIGNLHEIVTEKDVRKLEEMDPAQTVVYIDKSIVEDRNHDLLNNLAGLSKKFTVLYPGLSATAHAMRVLTDFGHTAITVGNRKFKTGERIQVSIKRDNQVHVSRAKRPEASRYIRDLFDAKLYGNEIIGGKALNLSILKSKGFNVPHGVVLTTRFYDKVLKESLGKELGKLLLKKEGLKKEEVKKLSDVEFTISGDLWRVIEKSGLISKDVSYAVRSSATVEDQEKHSFAGQFETVLDVPYKDLTDSVSKVIQSTFSPRIAQYFNSIGKPWSTKMAVVVQEMVDVEKAGVVFCKDVQTGDDDAIVIDVAPGLAEGVVDGVKETHRIYYSKSRGAVIRETGEMSHLLSPTELNALIEMSLSLERLMDGPQDIEWAIDKKGIMWLVQTRSI